MPYNKEKIDHKTKEYARIHHWVRTTFGKANKCENPKCEGKSHTFDWALRKGKNHEKKRQNYMQLCRPCHIKYDWTSDKTQRVMKIIHTKTAHHNTSKTMTGRTRTEQEKQNMSTGHREKGQRYFLRGEKLTLVEWCERFNSNYKTVWSRIFLYGWSLEKALTIPRR